MALPADDEGPLLEVGPGGGAADRLELGLQEVRVTTEGHWAWILTKVFCTAGGTFVATLTLKLISSLIVYASPVFLRPSLVKERR